MNAINPPPLAGHSVLVVDDNEPIRSLLVTYLGSLGCSVDSAPGGRDALARMHERKYDLVLLDLCMGDLDGLEVLKRAKAEGLARNYTMMSAQGTVGSAVGAIRLGAADFLVKPFELPKLRETVTRVLGRSPNATGSDDPRIAWRNKYAPRLIGDHERLLKIFLVLERIADSDCTVLINGESGTGKELVAQALHDSSIRAAKPFIPVNCGAIPETLIESELFGHAKGAFTGATLAREGRFEAADHGSLFLDEIGEMALAVQVKLLRVLQEKEFVPVGETRPRKADVRIVAATNKELEEMVDSGAFRQDLYFRLNTITITLPALRERVSDIPRLAEHFLSGFALKRKRQITGFSPQAMETLKSYRWPGNVRELENIIERITLLYSGNGIVELDDLPARVRDANGRGAPAIVPPPATSAVAANDSPALASANANVSHATDQPHRPQIVSAPTSSANNQAVEPPLAGPNGSWRIEDYPLPAEGLNLRATVEKLENTLIDQALARTGNNIAAAARLLGMNRTTLVERLRRRKEAPQDPDTSRAT